MHSHSHGHRHDRHNDKDLIQLPGSPFWNVFKRFGRDEMIAFAVSVVGTMVISFFTMSALILAFAGPVVEKIGFFPWHFYEARRSYLALPTQEQKSFLPYAWQAFKGGLVSLIEDVVVHDPVYVLLFLWLSFYPGIPVWLVSAFSFFVAIVIVAWIEVLVTEIRYVLFRRRMVKSGFGIDSYREARFFIQSFANQETILSRLQSGLNLTVVVGNLEYHDRYLENDLPDFSGRAPVVRLRRRTLSDRARNLVLDFKKMLSTGHMQTVQVVYTRPQEEITANPDQFRFFPVRKEKFYFVIDEEEMPDSADKLPQKIQKLIKADGQRKEISFRRTVFLDRTETLYVAVDTPSRDGDGCVIELKARKNLKLLLAAMRFVMTEFPVQHTTQSKSELPIFDA